MRPSLFCLFILHYRTLDFMHINISSLTLFAVKIVLRTFLVKFSLACANWRTIFSTMTVPCNTFLRYRITQKLEVYCLFKSGLLSS